MELIQQQLKAAGIEVTLKQLQVTQPAPTLQSGDYDAAWGNITRADPDALRSSFSTRPANFYRVPAGSLDTAMRRPRPPTPLLDFLPADARP
ncbi:hypothetical protein H0H10_03620 [Streptomyces sp. TRM S81-3]|uniref:Uncharacterized protein n=1 Tax=Streptomyces griseicoloratus TaxID=2752516 RepID=A0A926KXZ5_9ACTN|nr:hypothetical protein [Streptomyces griseicoloratus]MBD0418265.1 hypothetical protein [Streptomyces griseicoloratus]